MEIRKISRLTGNLNVLDVPISEDQLKEWRRGKLIEEVMPGLNEEQMEFMKSGIIGDEWSRLDES